MRKNKDKTEKILSYLEKELKNYLDVNSCHHSIIDKDNEDMFRYIIEIFRYDLDKLTKETERVTKWHNYNPEYQKLYYEKVAKKETKKGRKKKYDKV